MRRVNRSENNYLGEGSNAPQGEQAEYLETAELLGDEDISGSESSGPDLNDPDFNYSQLFGFDSSQDISPRVDSNYTRYLNFERRKSVLEERERNRQESGGARPKTLMTRLKKAVHRLKSNEETEPESDPYESLPKDEHGYPAVYGTYQGSGIHGPVQEDEFYTSYGQIGTQYREEPGTQLQQSYPLLFGSPNNPLNKNQLKFLKEKGMTFEKKLGEGSFGEVWLVRQHLKQRDSEGKKTTIDRMLACKVLSLRNMEKKQIPLKRAVDSIKKEGDIYSELDHLNIVKRYEISNLYDEETAFDKPITVLMFMERMEGDLHSLLHQKSSNDSDDHFQRRQQKCGWTESPEKFTHLWSKQIVSGLRYLHEHNICHMDLKSGNILYSTHMEGERKKYVFKLSDFGISLKFDSNRVDEQMATIGHSGHQVEPGDIYTKHDIYFLGLVMAESIASDKWDVNDVIEAIRHYDNRVGKTYNISRWFASLVASMLILNLDLRPDIFQVYDSDWLQMLM